MPINKTGLALIKKYEGFRRRRYLDVAGRPTIGYGHLIKKGESFAAITERQAARLLRQDLAVAEAAVKKYIKTRLAPNQYAALVSWTFNLGAGALRSSTMCKRVNEGQYNKVPGEMMRWVLADGRPFKGLIRRRADEAQLFIS